MYLLHIILHIILRQTPIHAISPVIIDEVVAMILESDDDAVVSVITPINDSIME
jgi:hypothetical protein